MGALEDWYFQNGRGGTLKTKCDQRNGIRFVFFAHLKKLVLELSLPIYSYLWIITKLRFQRHALFYLNPFSVKKKCDLVVGEFNLEKPILDLPRQMFLDETGVSCDIAILREIAAVFVRFILLTGARI